MAQKEVEHMEDKEIIECLNKAFGKLKEREVEIPGEICLFVNKTAFFGIQEKYYFVIGTHILINPFVFAYKRKYKKHIDEMFELFQQTNIDSAPAFKTRNAAKRAVAYNRKHKWITEKQEKEAYRNGYKLINTQPGIFMEEVEQ